jgi:small subunit ribosomal protein S11
VSLIKFTTKKDIILFTKLYFKFFNFKKKKLEDGFDLLFNLFRKVLNIDSISNYILKIDYLFLNVKFYVFILASFKGKRFNTLKIIKKLKIRFLKYFKHTYFHLMYLYSNYYYFGKIKVIFKSYNIFINVISSSGNTIKLYSSGKIGFKGRKKSTIIACRELSKICAKYVFNKFKFIDIEFIGKKGYTKPFIENILNSGLMVSKISIIDKAPHGGCRLKKKKRR